MGQQQSASLRRNSKKGSDKLLLTNYAHNELSKSKKGSTRKNKKSSSKHDTENHQEDMNKNQSSKVANLDVQMSISRLNLNNDKKSCKQEEQNVKYDQANDGTPAHDSTSVPAPSASPKLPPRDTKVKIDISHLDQLKKNEVSSSQRKFSDNSTIASKMFDQSTVGGTVAYTIASDANLSYNSHGFDRLINRLDNPTKMFNIDEDMSVNNISPTSAEQIDEIKNTCHQEKDKEHVSLHDITGMTERAKVVEKTEILTNHDTSTSETRKRSDSTSEASRNTFELERNIKQDTKNHVPSYITSNASIDSSNVVDEEEQKTRRPLLTNSKSKTSYASTGVDHEEKLLSQKNAVNNFHNSHSDEDEDTPDPEPETKPIQLKKHNRKKKKKDPAKDDIDDVVQLYYQSYLDDERDRRLKEVMKAEPPPPPPSRTKDDSGKKGRNHKIKFQQAESYSTQSMSSDDDVEKKERIRKIKPQQVESHSTKSISFDSYASSSASESLPKSKGREKTSADNTVDSTKKIRIEKSSKRTDDVTASIEDYYQTYFRDSSETSKIPKDKTGNANNDSAEKNEPKQSTNYQYYKRMRSRSRTRAESILRGQRDSENTLNAPKDEPKKHDSSSPYLNRMRSRSRSQSRARGESVVRRVEKKNPVPSTDAAEDVSNNYDYTRPQQRRMRSISRIRGESVIRRGKDQEDDKSRKASEICLSKEKSDEKDYSHQTRRRMRSLSQRREDAATRRAKEEIRIDTAVVDSPKETTATTNDKNDYGYSYNRMKSISRPREESVIRKDEDTKPKQSEMDSSKDYTADKKDYGYGYNRRMRSLSRPRGESVVRKTDYTKLFSSEAEPTKDEQQTRPVSRPRAESVARKIDEYTKLFSKELDTPKPTSNKQDYISPYNRRMRSISRPKEESVVRKEDDTKNISSGVDTSKGLSNSTNDFISPYHRRMRSISRTRKVSPVETDRKTNSIIIQASEEDKSHVAPYKSTPTANSRQERRRLRSQSPSPFMKNNDYQDNVSMKLNSVENNSQANNIQDATKKDVESSYLNPSERRRNLRSASPLYNRLNAKKVESKPSEDARPQLRQGESNRSVSELSICNKADEMISRLKNLSSNKIPPTIKGR